LPQGCSAKRWIIDDDQTSVQIFLVAVWSHFCIRSVGAEMMKNLTISTGMDKGAAHFPEVVWDGADAEK
jgi:hypothetical protein